VRDGPSPRAALPNLIVIGAKKCGTTSLHQYLASHPDVAMSTEKELDFFVAHRNWARGLDWYRRQFDATAAVRGESSPSYTALPHHRGVPERMARVIPDARLVYVVRDPVERLISHYHMEVAVGREHRPLAAAVADSSESRYVTQGRYWMQLDPYLRGFDGAQVLVVDQAELDRDRAASLRRVFAFLEVDPDFVSPDFDEVHFPAMARRRRRPVAIAVQALNRRLGRERSYRVRRRVPERVRWMLTAPVRRPDVEPALRARLEQIYAPEVARLREHTGLRFESWSL
jgi:Sulfotransferase domain